MSNVRVPHFDYPFHFGYTGHASVVEQDSAQEITTCITTCLLTNKGDRIELPTFGIDPLIFDRQPLPLDRLYSDIVEQEPRALMALSQSPDPTNMLTDLINIVVQNQQPAIGGT